MYIKFLLSIDFAINSKVIFTSILPETKFQWFDLNLTNLINLKPKLKILTTFAHMHSSIPGQTVLTHPAVTPCSDHVRGILFFKLIFIFLRQPKTEKKLSSVGHSPNAQSGLGQARGKNLELNSRLPRGRQGPKFWSHHLLPPKVCMARKLEWKLGKQDLKQAL